MEQKATFAIAEVKTAQTDSANGEFEMVMSTDSVDRDGESIVKGAFNPLPASIPVHAFHDFHDPIGRVVPEYDAEGRLIGRGFFGSTPRAQEIRQLVADGVIGHTSVGFMAATRNTNDKGVPEVTSGELLEVSFVSVPSNRDAAVLMVKEMDAAAAATPEAEQPAPLCAKCAEPTDPTTSAPEAPSVEDGKSPASTVVEQARLMARAALLSVED